MASGQIDFNKCTVPDRRYSLDGLCSGDGRCDVKNQLKDHLRISRPADPDIPNHSCEWNDQQWHKCASKKYLYQTNTEPAHETLPRCQRRNLPHKRPDLTAGNDIFAATKNIIVTKEQKQTVRRLRGELPSLPSIVVC